MQIIFRFWHWVTFLIPRIPTDAIIALTLVASVRLISDSKILDWKSVELHNGNPCILSLSAVSLIFKSPPLSCSIFVTVTCLFSPNSNNWSPDRNNYKLFLRILLLSKSLWYSFRDRFSLESCFARKFIIISKFIVSLAVSS